MSTVDQVPEIEQNRAKELHKDGGALFLDVRDPGSFTSAHIPEAQHINDGNIAAFVAEADKSKPVVVYCYHGRNSMGAAAYLLENGFETVWSLTGGFEAWRSEGPVAAVESEPASGAHYSLSPLAASKLKEYLGGEPDGTAVRITLEPNAAFGLALDQRQPQDLTLELEGIPFVMDRRIAPATLGLSIEFQDGDAAGFKLSGGSPPKPPGQEDMLGDIKQRIADNKVMLFMKGNASQPMCGFSAKTVEALRSTGKPFGDKNVLEVPQYRYALSEHSSWPTIPQVFIDGKFVGGCDIVLELKASGELQKLVDAAFAE